MPITWKNVEAASNKDGVALLAGAQQSMTSGLSTFENMMLNERKRQETAYAAEGKANDNTYQNALQGYTNVADLTAAKDSGALDAVVAGFGNTNYDQNAVRQGYNQQFDALNAREDALRVRTEAGYARDLTKAQDELTGRLVGTNTSIPEIQALVAGDPRFAAGNGQGQARAQIEADRLGDITANRDETLRVSAESSAIAGEAILQNITGTDNLNTIRERVANAVAVAADNGTPFDPTHIATLTKNVTDGFKLRTEVGVDGINAIATTTRIANENKTRDDRIALEQRDLANNQAPIDRMFELGNSDTNDAITKQTRAASLAVAAQNDWDPEYTSKILDSSRKEFLKDEDLFPKGTQLDALDTNMLERISYQALYDLGPADDWWSVGGEDVKASEMKERISDLWSKWVNNKANALKQRTNNTNYLTNLETTTATRDSAVSAEQNSQKLKARASNQSKSSVTTTTTGPGNNIPANWNPGMVRSNP